MLCAVALVGLACSRDAGERKESAATEDRADEREPQGDVLPAALQLRTLDGRTITAAELTGRRVIFNFGATWHKESRELFELMNAMYPRYSKRFRFFTVLMDEQSPAALRSFVQQNPIEGDVIVNGREVANAFGGVGKYPYSLVVLRNGAIARRLKGLYRRDQYEKFLSFFGMDSVENP
jgi:hypothetical protein